MIYVISHEIIPETHREGEHSKASGGLMVGLVPIGGLLGGIFVGLTEWLLLGGYCFQPER